MNAFHPTNDSVTIRPRVLQGMCALAAAILMALPATSQARIFLEVDIAPPPLVVYEQPPIPGERYIWTPGYWAYGDDGYFWVPGTWVLVPYEGALWTPGYWGWSGVRFVFHQGYWGRHVGFYGGVNYGYGYGGMGYEGGYWNRNHFYYNRGVNNFGSIRITNVYNRTVVNNITINRISYNGGMGGLDRRPSPMELRAEHERHMPPVAVQQRHIELASHNKQLFAKVNHGEPPIAATRRPGTFKPDEVVKAHPLAPEDRPAVEKAVAAKPVGVSVTPKVAKHPPSKVTPVDHANAGKEQPKLHAKPKQEVQPKLHAQPKQEAQPKLHAKPKQEIQPKLHAKPKQEVQPKLHALPKQQAQPKPQAKPQLRPEKLQPRQQLQQHKASPAKDVKDKQH